MNTSLSSALTGVPPVVWIDYTAYAARLPGTGGAAGLDVAQWFARTKTAQSLLRSSVVTVPIEVAAAVWLSEKSTLRLAMGSRNRPVFPLKTLLGDAGLRHWAAELARGLRAGFPALPLALVIPSPRAWVRLAYQQAHAAAAEEPDVDALESAAVYVADFVRAFADAAIDVVLLEESDSAPPSTAELIAYQPVCNVAKHYRWEIGIRFPGVGALTGLEAIALNFHIAPMFLPVECQGLAVGADFWGGGAPAPVPANGFYYARVAPDAVPEQVLERVATLRTPRAPFSPGPRP